MAFFGGGVPVADEGEVVVVADAEVEFVVDDLVDPFAVCDPIIVLAGGILQLGERGGYAYLCRIRSRRRRISRLELRRVVR